MVEQLGAYRSRLTLEPSNGQPIQRGSVLGGPRELCRFISLGRLFASRDQGSLGPLSIAAKHAAPLNKACSAGDKETVQGNSETKAAVPRTRNPTLTQPRRAAEGCRR